MERFLTVKSGIVGAIAFMIILLAFASTFTVQQYEQGIVTTWGKVARIEGPGIGLKIPFAQSVTKMRTDILSLQPKEKVNTYTEDNQEIDIMFTVFYRVPVSKVAFIYENVQDYYYRLYNIANDRVKAEMGKIKLEHFAVHRAEIRDHIRTILITDAQAIGIEVTDFQFTDVDYTKDFRNAVNAASVQKAGVETREWERVQAEKAALTKRIVAEGAANAIREEAKGAADAINVKATAEARAIQIKGEATAKAMEAQAVALMRNPVLVEMKKAEAWDGKLPVNMYAGAAIPFLQVGK